MDNFGKNGELKIDNFQFFGKNGKPIALLFGQNMVILGTF